MKESEFPQTFKKLKAILQAYQKHLTVTVDKKERYNPFRNFISF